MPRPYLRSASASQIRKAGRSQHAGLGAVRHEPGAARVAQAALRIVAGAGRPSNAGILVDALHVARSGTTLDDLRAIPRAL